MIMTYRVIDIEGKKVRDLDINFGTDVVVARDSRNDSTTVYMIDGQVLRLEGRFDLKGKPK